MASAETVQIDFSGSALHSAIQFSLYFSKFDIRAIITEELSSALELIEKSCYSIGMKKLVLFMLLLCAQTVLSAKGGKPLKIWDDIPAMRKAGTTMYMHTPDAHTENRRAAVIICPGGSYHHLGLYNEGYRTARWFSSKGVTAFTLRYRVAEAGNHYPAMMQDLQRAIQLVRENADEYGIDPHKIGLIGYSAGGHLVTMGGALYKTHNELENLGIECGVSLRPDFVIPVYPVVSMQDAIAHRWSRKSLLGKDQTQERKDEFSLEMQIPSDMPPTYIVVCKDDNVVDYKNSLVLYDALVEKHISAHLELYDWGKHGFGMLENKFMKTFRWNEVLWQWLTENNLL